MGGKQGWEDWGLDGAGVEKYYGIHDLKIGYGNSYGIPGLEIGFLEVE